MHRYQEVATPDDMEHLLELMGRFHDAMTREVHLINRGFVMADGSMKLPHRLDVSVLVQSQWEPHAIELIFSEVVLFKMDDCGEYWNASGNVREQSSPTYSRTVRMSFKPGFEIEARRLLHRVRSDWVGPSPRLGAEVPSPDAVAAVLLGDDWRQCSSCMDAWQEREGTRFSTCPSCHAVTDVGET